MKRLHVHIAVEDLQQSIAFYSALFAAQPAVTQADYAKWMLDDPRVNFAISQRGIQPGLDHLGIQVESGEELDEMHARLTSLEAPIASQEGTSCCYAQSDKHWVTDPQGIAWESFHTLASVPVFGVDQREASKSACCAPAVPVSLGMPKLKAKAGSCGSNESSSGSACC